MNPKRASMPRTSPIMRSSSGPTLPTQLRLDHIGAPRRSRTLRRRSRVIDGYAQNDRNIRQLSAPMSAERGPAARLNGSAATAHCRRSRAERSSAPRLTTRARDRTTPDKRCKGADRARWRALTGTQDSSRIEQVRRDIIRSPGTAQAAVVAGPMV